MVTKALHGPTVSLEAKMLKFEYLPQAIIALKDADAIAHYPALLHEKGVLE